MNEEVEDAKIENHGEEEVSAKEDPIEQEVLYDSEASEKARKWDQMQSNMQGRLYKAFMEQMQCKINIMTAMHKGYASVPEECHKLEELDYEILQLLALAMKNEATQKREKDEAQVRSEKD